MAPKPVGRRWPTSSPWRSLCLLGLGSGLKLPVRNGFCPTGTPKLGLSCLGENKLANQSCSKIVLTVRQYEKFSCGISVPEYVCGVNWHHLVYWYGCSQWVSGEANEKRNTTVALWILDPQGAGGEVEEVIKTAVNEGDRKGQGLC